MVNLTELELQNLKHLIGGHDTMAQKLEQYAQIAQEPEVKQYFIKGASCASQAKQNLLNFLQ